MLLSHRSFALAALGLLASQHADSFTPPGILVGNRNSFSPFHSSTITEATTDVSIPYDAAAKLAYDEWREKYGKGDFDANKYEAFKQNYEVIVVANVKAAKDRRDGKDAPSKMELNEFADMTEEQFLAARNKGSSDKGTGDVLSEALQVAASQSDASNALEEASAALAEEEEILAKKLGLGSVEELEIALDAMEGIAEDGGDLDTSVAREARIRSEYLEWCKKYDKQNDEARFQIFSENFLQLEEYSKENDVPMKLNKYADLTEDEYMQLMNPGAKVKEAPAPATEPAPEPAPAPAPKATIDVSIPYDAAAKLAYDEWREKYGKGAYDAKKYEIFKQNYEAVVVANVIAAKDRREGKDAPPNMELDKLADAKKAAPAAKSAPKKKGAGFLSSLFSSASMTDAEVLARQEEVKKRKEELAKQQADEAKANEDERKKRQASQDKAAETARLEAEAAAIAAAKEIAEKEAQQVAIRRENDLKAAEMERQKAAELKAKQAELQKKAELERQKVADSLAKKAELQKKAPAKAPPAPKPKVEAKIEAPKVEAPKVEAPKPKSAPPKPAPAAKKEAPKPDFFSSLFKSDTKSAAPEKKVELAVKSPPSPPVVPEKPPVKETISNIEVSDPVTDVFGGFFGSSKPKTKAVKSASVAKASVPTPKPAPVAKAPAPKPAPKPAFSFFSSPAKKEPETKKEPVAVKATPAPTPAPKKAFSFFGTPEPKKPEPKIETPPPAPVPPKKETFSFFSGKPKAAAPAAEPAPAPAPVKKAPAPMFSFGVAPKKVTPTPTPAPVPAPTPVKKTNSYVQFWKTESCSLKNRTRNASSCSCSKETSTFLFFRYSAYPRCKSRSTKACCPRSSSCSKETSTFLLFWHAAYSRSKS